MTTEQLMQKGEYIAAGLCEELARGVFYRRALGLRRFYENCELAVYGGEAIYPSGTVKYHTSIVPEYMRGMCGDFSRLSAVDPDVAKKIKAEFEAYRPSVPPEHTVAGNMSLHSMPHYERILAEGFLSYIPRIEKIADDDLREGLLHLVDGIKCYVSRCVEYLKSVSADATLIAALEKVPLYPAENVYEAIVAWNFVMYLDGCDNLGCVAKGLLPYYKGENLVPWLENLYANLDANNGYSMALDSECPELTVKCLTAAMGKRRPMIELFVDESTPEEVWQAALKLLRSGGGQPAFYNAEALLGGLKKRFPSIKDEDLERFCGGGCTESMLAGLSNVGSLDAGINLLLVLEKMIREKLPLANSFDEFYEAYVKEIEEVVETVKREINNSRIARAKYNPHPMRTLLIDDCIDVGKEFNAGGARYGWSIINFAGMTNVIDSLLTIKALVFDDKKYTAETLIELLQKNDKDFLTEAIGQRSSFGKDIDEVNEFAHELSNRIFATTNRGELIYGEGFLSASIQFMSQVGAGKPIGATPDGRSAGEPLADSLAAVFGKDTKGPTALLNSVTALDLKGALGVPVVNFNITQNFSNEILKALILGYMKNGGIQLQITYATKEELLDAYEHPERHGNLIVRVGGYSEYFNRLSDELKKMIINRTIQSGV